MERPFGAGLFTGLSYMTKVQKVFEQVVPFFRVLYYQWIRITGKMPVPLFWTFYGIVIHDVPVKSLPINHSVVIEKVDEISFFSGMVEPAFRCWGSQTVSVWSGFRVDNQKSSGRING